jgi:integrase
MWLVKPARTSVWHVRFKVPGGGGAVVQVSTGETTEKAARKRGAEIEQAHKDAFALTQRGANIGAEEVARQFWDSDLSKRKSAETARAHLSRVVDHLEGRRYCEVTTSDVADFRDKLEASGCFAVATINRHLETWRRMHTHARDIRGYPVNPILFSKLMKKELKGRVRHLSVEQLRELVREMPLESKEIVLFAAATGARKAQILGLTWDRVNLKAHTCRIYLKSEVDELEHVIHINTSAMKILLRRKRLQKGERSLVFDSTNFRRHWYAGLKRARIEDFRFHDLRHTFATEAARTSSLAVVGKLLGHQSLTTTSRYAHLLAADLKAAVERLPPVDLED